MEVFSMMTQSISGLCSFFLQFVQYELVFPIDLRRIPCTSSSYIAKMHSMIFSQQQPYRRFRFRNNFKSDLLSLFHTVVSLTLCCDLQMMLRSTLA